MKLSTSFGAVLVANAANSVAAIQLNVQDPGSIKAAASTIAYGLVTYYKGNVTNTPETIAILPPPHYWWQAGAMWGLLLDYYHLTGDGSYNTITTQALLSQVGPKNDYMMPLYELQEANDDQAFWGFASMSAAEKGYPDPPTGPTWLQLTENLWNTQVYRWDTTTCGGGLKWQIFDFNKGYFYKNSVSNGAFFQLSARLARFTGNQTYFDWAEKSWDWSESVGLVGSDHAVYDGTDSLKNCVDQNHIEWSYNLGIYLYGAAMLFDATDGNKAWADRTQGLLDHSAFFFSPFDNATNVMYEYACEPVHTCNYDQFSFKGYLARFMWATTLVAPFTKETITKLLTASATAAANSCSGGRDGVTCGTKWYTGGWDGTYGVGQQMSALETIQGLLIQNSPPPRRAQAERKPEPVTTTSIASPVSTTKTTTYEAPAQISKTSETTKGQLTTIPSAEPVSTSPSVQPTVIEISPGGSTSEEPLATVEISTSSASRSPTSVVVSLSSSSERLTSAVVTPSPLIVISTSVVGTQILSTKEPTSEVMIPISSSTTPTSLVVTSTSFEMPNATKTPSSTSEELTTAEPLTTSEEPEPEPTTIFSSSTSTTSSTISTSSLIQETSRSEKPTSSTSSFTTTSSTTSSTTSYVASSSVTSGFVTSSTTTESSREVLTTSSTGEASVPTRAPAESLTKVDAVPTPTGEPSGGRKESMAWGMGASFMIACLGVLYLS